MPRRLTRPSQSLSFKLRRPFLRRAIHQAKAELTTSIASGSLKMRKVNISADDASIIFRKIAGFDMRVWESYLRKIVFETPSMMSSIYRMGCCTERLMVDDSTAGGCKTYSLPMAYY